MMFPEGRMRSGDDLCNSCPDFFKSFIFSLPTD